MYLHVKVQILGALQAGKTKEGRKTHGTWKQNQHAVGGKGPACRIGWRKGHQNK